jgi:membrane protein DedA with SNARE-associated domain
VTERKQAETLAELAAKVDAGFLMEEVLDHVFEDFQTVIPFERIGCALIEEGGRWASAYAKASSWFHEWGFWAVLIAGFSPIPYKVFTISAGALAMSFLPFVLASAVGRGARFFLVAGLLSWGGPAMEDRLRLYVERIGWGLVALGAVAYLVLRG